MMADDLWLILSIVGVFFVAMFAAWADVTRWHKDGEVDKGKRPAARDL